MPGTVTNRDAFLTAIDGMLYGDDPKQGIIDGNNFIHPELRFAFDAPSGYSLVNGTRAVTIYGPVGQGAAYQHALFRQSERLHRQACSRS